MSLPAIDQMLVSTSTVLRDVMKTIDKNAQGIVFVVDKTGSLVGVVTDGDIRRALIKGSTLDDSVTGVMNTDYISRSARTNIQELLAILRIDGIRHIPLVDDLNHPVDYACAHRLHRIPVTEPLLNGNELAYVTDCIETNWISSQGTYVRKFEDMFVEFCKVPHALAVSNGTSALHLAIEALGIGEGDEVIVPDFTFAASINTVLHARATPVLVDVHPRTWTLDPEVVRKAITSQTKAIMPVHLYGHPCHMSELIEIAKKHKLLIIEDCAEALGSRYQGEPIGSFGDASAFSFFGNKTITTGEGGMVLFKNNIVAERAKRLRDHGMSKERRYWHEEVGYNYRMTNLQGAIGVAQMERIEELLTIKRNIAQRYNNGLKNISCLTLPPEEQWAVNTFWLYTILVEEEVIKRDDLIAKLLLNGIETRPVFYALHEMPLYRRFSKGQEYPVATMISKKGLSLPSAVSLSDQEIASVTNSIESIVSVRNIVTGA